MKKLAGSRAKTFDILPKKYKVTRKHPKPPTFQYALPVPMETILDYNRWLKASGNLDPGENINDMLSDICVYPLKLGQPFIRTDEDGYFLQLYNNYDLVCGQVPTLE